MAPGTEGYEVQAVCPPSAIAHLNLGDTESHKEMCRLDKAST